MTDRNVAFSQPYYSRHPILHLRRGEVNAFSKAFYNAAASLADRETYTFWEHYFHASPHKTHEEAWFLMENRWRLYLEEGDTLSVLPGIPRAYLEDGKRIEIDGMKSYFGPIRLSVRSELAQRRIVAQRRVPVRPRAPARQAATAPSPGTEGRRRPGRALPAGRRSRADRRVHGPGGRDAGVLSQDDCGRASPHASAPGD